MYIYIAFLKTNFSLEFNNFLWQKYNSSNVWGRLASSEKKLGKIWIKFENNVGVGDIRKKLEHFLEAKLEESANISEKLKKWGKVEKVGSSLGITWCATHFHFLNFWVSRFLWILSPLYFVFHKSNFSLEFNYFCFSFQHCLNSIGICIIWTCVWKFIWEIWSS